MLGSKRPVIILGMHRSGTSALAGSLQQCGLYLGEVQERSPHNPKGNRENREIMHLNNAVLAANGGSWDKPPKSVLWNTEHRKLRDDLIAHYPADRAWGFKDPRTVLVLDGWLEALPDARMIGTFRHPWAVTASLRKRMPGLAEAACLEMWRVYNQCLLDVVDRDSCKLVCFDVGPSDYVAAVSRLAMELGLKTCAPNGFHDPGLVSSNQAVDDRPLPDAVSAIYSALTEYMERNG